MCDSMKLWELICDAQQVETKDELSEPIYNLYDFKINRLASPQLSFCVGVFLTVKLRFHYLLPKKCFLYSDPRIK